MLHRGKDAAQGAARFKCLNWFLCYSLTVSFHQFPKHFGGNSFRIRTYENSLIHISNASRFYRQRLRWVLRWGVLTAEKSILGAEAGRMGTKCTLPCSKCHSRSSVSLRCRDFAYECESFLVAEVEVGNNSVCRAARFHPRDSLTQVTSWGSLSPMCPWAFFDLAWEW